MLPFSPLSTLLLQNRATVVVQTVVVQLGDGVDEKKAAVQMVVVVLEPAAELIVVVDVLVLEPAAEQIVVVDVLGLEPAAEQIVVVDDDLGRRSGGFYRRPAGGPRPAPSHSMAEMRSSRRPREGGALGTRVERLGGLSPAADFGAGEARRRRDLRAARAAADRKSVV